MFCFLTNFANIIKYVSAQVANYNGNKFGNQGPTRLTSALKIFCKAFNNRTIWPHGVTDKDEEICIPKNFTVGQTLSVVNSRYGYPVHYTQWQRLLDDTKSNEVLQRLDVNKAFAIHLWNFMSHGKYKHIPSPSSAYAEIASRHCPITYNMLFRS